MKGKQLGFQFYKNKSKRKVNADRVFIRQFGRDEYYSYDKSKIKEALSFAKTVHLGKLRKSGEPYINHPVEVAEYALRYGCKTNVIVASLLHDVIEDGNVNHKIIEKKFGKPVARMVINLTKPRLHGRRWLFANDPLFYRVEDEYTRELYHERSKVYYDHLINSGDLDAILIKLFDNIHNLETIDYVTDEQQRRNADIIARHSVLLASRLFDRDMLSFFKETLERINPKFSIKRYIDSVSYSSEVIVLPPRSRLNIDMFRKLPPPTRDYISIYGGPEFAFVYNYVEVGLPTKARQDFELLKQYLSMFKVVRGRSMVPRHISAHEFIVKVSGFREDIPGLRLTQNRVYFNVLDSTISLPKSDVVNLKIKGEYFEKAKEKFHVLKEQLKRFFQYEKRR